MTKHDALKDLAAVLRDTPTRVPRIESGPAPLTPSQRFVNLNPAVAQAGRVSSLFTQLLPSLTGLGGAGASSGSLIGELLGSRQGNTKGAGGFLGSLLGANSQGGAGGALGLGLAPLLTGLLGFFGGGGKSAPPQLTLYSAPQRLQLQAGLQGGVVTGADSNQSGMPRANGVQPQVTLHIQAMDTQSILNRSTDIAAAVRQAMLQSHPINDIVADL